MATKITKLITIDLINKRWIEDNPENFNNNFSNWVNNQIILLRQQYETETETEAEIKKLSEQIKKNNEFKRECENNTCVLYARLQELEKQQQEEEDKQSLLIQKQKDQENSCSVCGGIIKNKAHDFPVGKVCHSCFMSVDSKILYNKKMEVEQ